MPSASRNAHCVRWSREVSAVTWRLATLGRPVAIRVSSWKCVANRQWDPADGGEGGGEGGR